MAFSEEMVDGVKKRFDWELDMKEIGELHEFLGFSLSEIPKGQLYLSRTIQSK